jgi:hypothetical protein
MHRAYLPTDRISAKTIQVFLGRSDIDSAGQTNMESSNNDQNSDETEGD